MTSPDLGADMQPVSRPPRDLPSRMRAAAQTLVDATERLQQETGTGYTGQATADGCAGTWAPQSLMELADRWEKQDKAIAVDRAERVDKLAHLLLDEVDRFTPGCSAVTLAQRLLDDPEVAVAILSQPPAPIPAPATETESVAVGGDHGPTCGCL